MNFFRPNCAFFFFSSFSSVMYWISCEYWRRLKIELSIVSSFDVISPFWHKVWHKYLEQNATTLPGNYTEAATLIGFIINWASDMIDSRLNYYYLYMYSREGSSWSRLQLKLSPTMTWSENQSEVSTAVSTNQGSPATPPRRTCRRPSWSGWRSWWRPSWCSLAWPSRCRSPPVAPP